MGKWARPVSRHGARKKCMVRKSKAVPRTPSLATVVQSLHLPGYGGQVLERLRASGAPCVLVLLTWLIKRTCKLAPKVDHLELFAGCQSITRAYLQLGKVAVPLEIKLDPVWGDILGARGREFALSSYCLSPDLYTRVMYARDYVNMMMEDCFLLRSHFLSPLLPSFHHD